MCKENDATAFICQNCGFYNSAVTTSCSHITPHSTTTHNDVSGYSTTPKTPSVEPNRSYLPDNRVFIEDIDEKDEFINTNRGTKRRLYYPGDVKDDVDLTPRSSKKFIRNLKRTVTKQRVKIQTLNKRKRRALSRISTLKSLVNDLKRKNLVSENALESLKVFDYASKCVVKLCLSRSFRGCC